MTSLTPIKSKLERLTAEAVKQQAEAEKRARERANPPPGPPLEAVVIDGRGLPTTE